MADYSKTTWVAHSTSVSASLLNHGETQYDTAKSEYQAGSWGGTSTTYADAANYIIYRVSSTYYAKNTATGAVDSSSSAASTVFQYVADALSSGGTIAVRPGTYVMLTAVTLAAGTFIDANGAYFDVTGLNATVFTFGVDTVPGYARYLRTGIRGCHVLGAVGNTSTWFIRINQCKAGSLIADVFMESVNNGFYISGACYDCLIQHCTVDYFLGTAVQINGWGAYAANDVHIDHLETYGSDSGTTSTDVLFSGETPGESCVITNCWLENTNKNIVLLGPRHKVTGNYLLANHGTTPIGITLSTGAAQAIISDNVFYLADDTDATGIKNTLTWSRSVIEGNLFTAVSYRAIDLANSFLGVINNNMCILNMVAAATFVYGNTLNCSIDSNVIIGDTKAYGIGIQSTTGSDYTAINGNMMLNLATGIIPYGANLTVTGNIFVNMTNGVDVNNCTNSIISSNTFETDVTNPILGTLSDGANKAVHNFGYYTQMAGKAQFAAQTTLVVTHGMNGTPTTVRVTGSNADTTTLYVDTIGATTFKVTRTNSTGTPWIYWDAEV